MTKQFELLNTYNKETAKTLDVMRQYAEQEKEAQELVNTLIMFYEDTVKRHVIEDKDLTIELQKINNELDAAEEDLKNKQRMKQVAGKVDKRTISKQQLESEFRKFQAQYQQEHVDEDIKEVRKAKEAYVKALLKYKGTINDFDMQARAVQNVLSPNSPFMPFSVGFKSQPQVERYAITSHDLKELERGIMPQSLKK
ncbi:hypothetical protein ABEW00_05025 [Rossellomorea vietnamensis]|uniref:hypothetical protein n=1 Tax=Rossellomorea vietnamensis TaxID=218284 RepID=UPI003D274202